VSKGRSEISLRSREFAEALTNWRIVPWLYDPSLYFDANGGPVPTSTSNIGFSPIVNLDRAKQFRLDRIAMSSDENIQSDEHPPGGTAFLSATKRPPSIILIVP